MSDHDDDLDGCGRVDVEPDHHRRYREAWTAYCTNLDADRARELEREMDAAQNHFGWDEFQTFKDTLDGFNDYWAFLPGHLARKANAAT